MKKNKLRLIAVALSTLFIANTFVGCKASEAKEEINILNYGANAAEGVYKEFEKETGIKVNEKTFDDMHYMYQEVASGKVKYDVILVSDDMADKMIKEDMLQKINKDNIPNIVNMNEGDMGKEYDPNNDYTVPYMNGTIGLIYNTEVIDEDITSWKSLFDSKYKDEVYMFNSLRDSLAIALIKAGYSINSTVPSEIEAAKEELLNQRKLTNPVYVVDEVKDNMISGEKMLATVWSGDAIYIMNENPDMKYVVPEEGSNKWVDALCIPKDAPNKAGAEAFINFLCDPENAKENVDYIGYSTPNTAAYDLLDEETKNNPAAYPSEETLSKCVLFTNLDPETLKLYEAAFTEVLSQ